LKVATLKNNIKEDVEMTQLMALSITTGILCGVWSYISGPIGLLAWIGFGIACDKSGDWLYTMFGKAEHTPKEAD